MDSCTTEFFLSSVLKKFLSLLYPEKNVTLFHVVGQTCQTSEKLVFSIIINHVLSPHDPRPLQYHWLRRGPGLPDHGHGHDRRGWHDHVPGHVHENMKLILRPLNIVHEVELNEKLKACYKYSGTHQKVHINLIFCPNHSFWIFTPDINKSTSYRKDVCHHRHILLIQIPWHLIMNTWFEGKLVN